MSPLAINAERNLILVSGGLWRGSRIKVAGRETGYAVGGGQVDSSTAVNGGKHQQASEVEACTQRGCIERSAMTGRFTVFNRLPAGDGCRLRAANPAVSNRVRQPNPLREQQAEYQQHADQGAVLVAMHTLSGHEQNLAVPELKPALILTQISYDDTYGKPTRATTTGRTIKTDQSP